MPILPGLCDDDANLEAVIQKTADHGGRFVLASSLTLSDRQKTYFFNKMRESMSDLLPLYENLFPPESYAPHEDYWHRIALRVRDLCMKYNISDRIPRPIIPGEKFALNKRIVEKLANTSYEMELRKEKPYHIWAYRKAAWAVEDLDRDISLIHQRMGLKGLQSIPNIGPRLGEKIAEMLPGLNYEIG